MRKIVLASLIFGLLVMGSCAHRVIVTQQGTTYNDFEASKYRKVEKSKSSAKHKSKKKKKAW